MDKTLAITVLQYAVPVLGALPGLLRLAGVLPPAPIATRKRRAVQDYELVTKFMQLPLEGRSRVEVELAFSAWQRRPLSYQEIDAIRQFANPSMGFRMYKVAKPFVQQAKNGHFAYRPKYAEPWSRRWRIVLWGAVYFVLAVLALAPLLALRPTKPIPSGWWVIALTVLVFFLYFAWVALSYATQLKHSERFLDEQKRRS